MSSGPEDAHAVGEIGNKVYMAALDLKIAIGRAKQGHRGLTVDILEMVNEELQGTGYRLVGYQEPKILRRP